MGFMLQNFERNFKNYLLIQLSVIGLILQNIFEINWFLKFKGL